MQGYHAELSNWNRDLAEQAKALGDRIAHLDRLSNVWQTTLRLPELSQAAPAILKRVQGLIDHIDRLRQVAESRRATVLALQGGVLELAAQVQTDSFSTEVAQTDDHWFDPRQV